MSKDDKATPLMARIDVTPSEWVEIRTAALRDGVTTQQWIGQVLRDKLASKAAAA